VKEKEQSESKIEMSWFAYKILKANADKYNELHRSLLEYMGYEDEFLITRAGLNKLKKDELATIVLEQRNMIRKLIDDLEPDKREKHMQFLDDLYMNKDI
jgi:hypothetical protein